MTSVPHAAAPVSYVNLLLTPGSNATSLMTRYANFWFTSGQGRPLGEIELHVGNTRCAVKRWPIQHTVISIIEAVEHPDLQTGSCDTGMARDLGHAVVSRQA